MRFIEENEFICSVASLLLGIILISTLILFSEGCTTVTASRMAECRSLCTSEEVQEFKDESLVCKCQLFYKGE